MKLLMLTLKRWFFPAMRHSHMLAIVRRNSWRKLANLIHNLYEQKTGKTRLKSKPFLVNSEPTSHCNFSCPFCPTGKSSGRKGGFASTEDYKTLIDQLGRYIYLMTFHGWGEPLLWKQLPEAVSHARKAGIYTVVTTNASLLAPENAGLLLDAGLDHIILSIDGASEETYRQYRKGGHFDRVIENVRELVRLKKTYPGNTLFVEWQFLVFSHNEHEMTKAREMARDEGVDAITFLPAYTEDSAWDATDERYRLPRASPLKQVDCKRPWTTLTFHWNGQVVPCCYDYFGDVAYAGLGKESFKDFWNNEAFRQSRETILRNDPGINEKLYCSSCIGNIGKADKIETAQAIEQLEEQEYA